MNRLTRVVAASLAAGVIAGAFGMAAADPDHVGNPRGGAGSAGGGGDYVSKADFFRLQGQVTELERRVSALEQGGHGPGKPGKGKGVAGQDDWQNR